MIEINIKGMVCRHCIEAVERALTDAGFPDAVVTLGRAQIEDARETPQVMEAIDAALSAQGFSRVLSADELLVERAKAVIINHIRNNDCNFNLSVCLSSHLNADYALISRAFSALEGRTIEKYAIAQRVEYVKELLSYHQLTITEIADRTGYSSVGHLSRQFKSVTGMTPTQFLSHPCGRQPINAV